jgi:hypothetical protein
MSKPEQLAHLAPNPRSRQIVSEEDGLFTMSNLRPDFTGLPDDMVVWISPKADSPHDVRVKVTKGAKYRKGQAVSVGLRPDIEVIKDQVWQFSSQDFERFRAWIQLNYKVLLDFWDEKILYDDEVKALLKKLQPDEPF